MWLLLACTAARQPGGDIRFAEKDTAITTGGDSPSTDSTTDSTDSTTDSTTDSEGGDSTGDTNTEVGCPTYGTPVSMGTVADAELDEISGVAPSQQNPGVLWVVEDHGADPVVVALDTTGATLATLTLTGATNNDWEDLALSPCEEGWCLWIGDIGNNGYVRTEHSLLRIVEPAVVSGVDDSATPTIYTVAYPDEAQDAEALVVNKQGTPLLITKRTDATARVYAATLDATTLTTLTLQTTLELGSSMATAADYWPAYERLLVRTYSGLYEYPVQNDIPDGAAGVPIPFSAEQQGEAAAYDPVAQGYWHVSEGINPTLWFIPCVTLAPRLAIQ